MIAGVSPLCFHLFPDSGTMEGALRLFPWPLEHWLRAVFQPARQPEETSSKQAPYHSLPRKRESSLISLLFLSEPNPLRWALAGYQNRPGGKSLRGGFYRIRERKQRSGTVGRSSSHKRAFGSPHEGGGGDNASHVWAVPY